MCFKKKKKGRFVFLCRNECYFSEFRFPTRYILVVITHLNSFMYVTLLVNTYCLQFPFNLAYFRERKKKTMKQLFLLFKRKTSRWSPKKVCSTCRDTMKTAFWGDLLKCNHGYQKGVRKVGRSHCPSSQAILTHILWSLGVSDWGSQVKRHPGENATHQGPGSLCSIFPSSISQTETQFPCLWNHRCPHSCDSASAWNSWV